eukprot:1463109-Pyramimonas_sp.AAC.1
MGIPDKTMTSILDAYHQYWMQFGPANALYSDGEGALNNDITKAVLRQGALGSGDVRVDNALRRSKPDIAYCAVYFMSWKPNPTG